MALTPTQVLDKMKKDGVRWVDLQFVDLLGGLQHITIPAHTLDEKSFKNGVPKLDGSSIKGFKEIHESDMVMVPDPGTYAVLPWYDGPDKTARFIVDVCEGGTKERFSRDSRFVAQQAARAAEKAGYDQTYWGPELEFFVFEGVRMFPNPLALAERGTGGGYEIVSAESPWRREGNGEPLFLNPMTRFKEGYYPAPPVDTLVEFRNEACRVLEDSFGIETDAHHHEVATAGQCEINMHYDGLVGMGDKVATYKYVIKNVAKKHGKLATFMPKPIYGDNASGMHVHQSLWTNGGKKNAFYDPNDKYAEVSQTCRYYIGGLMEHARALCAITNPTTNSYRRLVPGYEAPVFIAWSRRNRSANVRIPVYETGVEKAKRIEYRTPDPSCNFYLAQSAMLAAGLDGIKKKMDPGDPVDEDLYHLSPAKRKQLGVRELPGSLRQAVEELESDHDFLKGVWTQDLMDKYIEMKLDEHLQTQLRISPYEVFRYLDV